MALIQCPECKRLVSEKASACPKCGFQITSEIVKKYKINHPKLGETMNCIACKRVIHKESDFCKYCKQDLSDEGLHKFRIEHPSYFATVKCPTCKKTISELSTQCMYCNTDIQPEEMAALKAHSSKRRSKGCITIISVFFLLVFIMYIAEPQKEKHKNEQLASHQVIKKTDEETTVSFKHFVSLMVDEDIKRQELKSLLLHYMNERVSARTTKKFVLYVYAYTDSLRYKRGEQWIGMLEFNEFQNSTPRITFDEINLFDGALKKAEVNDPLREKMFFDVSDYDYEATLIMEDKYPMSTNDQITYMQNDRNRNQYIAEEEATKDKLIRYYMKKHALTRSQFDALYAEGNEKNWTKKSVEESKKIKAVYRSFM